MHLEATQTSVLVNQQGLLLGELKQNNMQAPVWKGYEVAANIILDPEEWTTDNDMLTPSMKVKLRNLMSHHEAEIAKIQG